VASGIPCDFPGAGFNWFFRKDGAAFFALRFAKRVFYQAVFERVVAYNDRAAAGAKNALERSEHRFEVFEFAVRRDAECLEGSRRRIDPSALIPFGERAPDNSSKIAARPQGACAPRARDRARNLPRIPLSAENPHDPLDLVLGHPAQEFVERLRRGIIGHVKRLVAEKAESPAGRLDLLRRKPEVKEQAVGLRKLVVAENVRNFCVICLGKEYALPIGMELPESLNHAEIEINPQKYSGPAAALQDFRRMASAVERSVDHEQPGAGVKKFKGFVKENGDVC
jgi:hypothetical protein